MARLFFSRCLVCPIRGRCCYFSIFINDNSLEKPLNLILTKHPCIYLNTKTGLCTIYKDRKKHYEGCLSIKEAKQKGALPVGCLYLKKGETYPVSLKRLPPKDLEYYYQAIYDCENNKPHEEFQKEKLEHQILKVEKVI